MNLTPWPLSQQDDAGGWGWTREGAGPCWPSHPTPTIARFRHTGGSPYAGGLRGYAKQIKSGDRVILRMRISNVFGTFNGISIGLIGDLSGVNQISQPVNGLMYVTGVANSDHDMEIYIGIGWVYGESSSQDAGYDITDVATQICNPGYSVPMDYHAYLDDMGYVWNHTNGSTTYGGDKSRVAFNRTGDVTITGTNTFTETYGPSLSTTDNDVIGIFGDSLTQAPWAWTGLIDRRRHDVAMYGTTIGGWALGTMLDKGRGIISDVVNAGTQWGGLRASRIIVERCGNDLWTGLPEDDSDGPSVVDKAKIISLWCLQEGLPVLFFGPPPVWPSIWLSPEGYTAHMYYQANVLTETRAHAVANGYDPNNIQYFNPAPYLEMTPGSHRLSSARGYGEIYVVNPGPPEQLGWRYVGGPTGYPEYDLGDGIHWNELGQSVFYDAFVGGGHLDSFMTVGFEHQDQDNQIHQRHFPRRIPWRVEQV